MKRSIVKRWILGGALGVLIAVGGVSGLALARHDSVGAGDNWPGHGGAPDEAAFSSLTQIDREDSDCPPATAILCFEEAGEAEAAKEKESVGAGRPEKKESGLSPIPARPAAKLGSKLVRPSATTPTPATIAATARWAKPAAVSFDLTMGKRESPAGFDSPGAARRYISISRTSNQIFGRRANVLRCRSSRRNRMRAR